MRENVWRRINLPRRRVGRLVGPTCRSRAFCRAPTSSCEAARRRTRGECAACRRRRGAVQRRNRQTLVVRRRWSWSLSQFYGLAVQTRSHYVSTVDVAPSNASLPAYATSRTEVPKFRTLYSCLFVRQISSNNLHCNITRMRKIRLAFLSLFDFTEIDFTLDSLCSLFSGCQVFCIFFCSYILF